MTAEIRYLVDCKRGGRLLATCEFAQMITLAGPPPQPDRGSLEMQAKDNLAEERLAVPPFDGVTFHIRQAWS
jgi:hypothetical protein